VHPNGEYVLFADHDAEVARLESALTAERTRREALAAALRAVMENLNGECDCIYSSENDSYQCPCKMARAALSSGKTEEDKG
jgi:vacuolar-type H+-ATPase subunit E/Vma4